MTDYMAVDTDLPPYFPYPQFLMDMPLSHTAALTYALLLDRAHLSQLNGWTDEAGRVYLIFPVEKIATALNRSLSSAKVFYDDAVNFTLPYVLEHLLKCRTVKAFTAETVVDIITHNGNLVLASPFFNHESLILYRPMGISVENR